MLFKVTHIDPAGTRRQAWVTAPTSWDAIDQMDAAFGASSAGQAVHVDCQLLGVA